MLISAATLYVVATPIGNLGDISHRALEILAAVDLIAAEDTRHSKRLLTHFGINTPLLSLHDYNERSRLPRLLGELAEGKSLALVSDAGTPLVSDPGFQLVRGVRASGFPVRSIPGPCSAIAALSIAGLPSDRFAFEGFLPVKAGARRARLATLANSDYTLIFFEAARRLRETLADMVDSFGARRQALLARELTKTFEQSRLDSLSRLLRDLDADDDGLVCRGEFVIVVGAATASSTANASVSADAQRLLGLLLAELPLKRAVKLTAAATGEARNALYQLALLLTDAANPGSEE